MEWDLLVLSLPTANTTARMRAWRSLKATGAAVLRDGVYLLPASDAHQALLGEIADDVRASDGNAELLRVTGADNARFATLFDRTADFAALLAQVTAVRDKLDDSSAGDALKQARRLRKAFAGIAAIDFFAGEAQRQTAAALDDLDAAAHRLVAPDEPHPVAKAPTLRRLGDYRGRVWATRRRPWVDRLASAWLIRRFIDRKARFVWLEATSKCPRDAVGFDFDGAAFSHVGARVTFETLVASFQLERPALARVGAIVHYLDIGGVAPPEADGVERVLAGMRESIDDDDRLLGAACGVFDGLLAAYDKELGNA